MPTAREILESLARAANEGMTLAFYWHVALFLAVAALLVGKWRPKKRTAGILLALPLASVSGAAWSTGNVFNGSMFAAAAIALGLVGAWLPRTPVVRGPSWAVGLGALTVAYGWVYPHFLEGVSPWYYLTAAPVGLVPCPTLAVLIGFTLIAGGFASRAWSFTLAALGTLYALFGMFVLRVWLDAGLALATAGLLAVAFSLRRTAPRMHTPHPAL